MLKKYCNEILINLMLFVTEHYIETKQCRLWQKLR
jgi:hypothetical protein